MEIERKFLILRLPEHLDEYPKQRIEQAYLSADPVVRIRRPVSYTHLTLPTIPFV